MNLKALLALVLSVLLCAGVSAQIALPLKAGDRICLVGNGIGEGLNQSGSWEALLHSRFADQGLTVRNLCVPGDEVVRRLRPAGFGTATAHLTREEASVVIGFFGLSESFAGQDGLEKFRSDLTTWIDNTLAAKYAGDDKPSPRVALVSPCAAEPLPGIDAKRLNLNLKLYSEAMRGVAAQMQLPFVDLFSATEKAFATGVGATSNGVTINSVAYPLVAGTIEAGLFGSATRQAPPVELVALVKEKSLLYQHRYRPSNGAAFYGPRAANVFEPDREVSNGTVTARELEILDALCAAKDREIWKAAGAKTEFKPADPAPAPVAVKTNFGTGKNRGKEGSTTYLKPSQAKGKFRPAEGYAIDLWASELDFPELANPSAMTFDDRGRLWVACMPSYPGFTPDPKAPALPNDHIVRLDDFDNDGRADRAKVFATGLHLPTGLAVGDGGVYVAAAPDLWFLKDTTGDGVADQRQRLLTGFGTANSHHGINSLTWGPDGWLYFAEGSFDTSSIETAHGTVRMENAGIYRYHPRSRTLERFAAYNFTNPHGIAFDDWGNMVIADAATGALFYGNPLSGRIEPSLKHGPGRPFVKARTSPITGCTFVTGKHFPDEARGDLLAGSCIGILGALRFDLNHLDSDSFYRAEEAPPVVLSTDGNFRPVDLDFGPDGALYLCDWHNALLGHFEHNLRDPNRDQTHGRIWRVTAKGRALDSWPKIHDAKPEELLGLLAHNHREVRHHAKMALRQLPAKAVLNAAGKWGAGLDKTAVSYERSLVEILYLHQHLGETNTRLLRSLFRAKDARIRATATRILADWRTAEPGALSMLRVLAGDEDPRVRLEAVRAASFFPDERALEILALVGAERMDAALEYTHKEATAVLRRQFPAPPEDSP